MRQPLGAGVELRRGSMKAPEVTSLCVLTPELGVPSETFIRWDIEQLLPGRTSVIVDPPPEGASVRGAVWDAAHVPGIRFAPVADDPPPSRGRRAVVRRLLAERHVDVVLVEYLDFADRWFDEISQAGPRVWVRGHGVDLAARLRSRDWSRRYERYAYADGVLLPSRSSAARLRRLGLPEAKLHVVPYAVDIPFHRQPGVAADGVVRCVAVGRLVEKKSPLETLEAFAAATTDIPRLSLDLIGDGPLRDDVVNCIEQLRLGDRVRLRGWLPHPDVLAALSGAHILLHHAVTASDGDAEGQPLVVLEAMAAGAAVIATRHEGITDVVVDGLNGRLVAEWDTAAMARAIVDLATDSQRRTRLTQAARRTVAENHEPRVVRRTLLEKLRIDPAEPAS